VSDRASASSRPYPWHIDLEDAAAAPSRRPDFVQYLRANGRPDDDYAAAELIFGELVGNAFLGFSDLVAVVSVVIPSLSRDSHDRGT
jgi:hypothetical protein